MNRIRYSNSIIRSIILTKVIDNNLNHINRASIRLSVSLYEASVEHVTSH